MLNVSINWVAVVVATVVHMVLGGLWFSPVLFGNPWIKLMGMTPKRVEECKKKGGKAMALMAVFSLVMSSVLVFMLAHVANYLGPLSWMHGLVIGVLLWAGFLNTVKISGLLFHSQKFKLYLIETAYELATVVLMAMVITMWY